MKENANTKPGLPAHWWPTTTKKACENFWAGKINLDELQQVAYTIREENWQTQLQAGIDLIPCNDYSYYDQMLDMNLLLGVIPERYAPVTKVAGNNEIDLYFAMARGYQKTTWTLPPWK
ncbi:hypothetical protein [Mucilaginibacter antarcticus]|uniref:hypothetical protein n=1 Tax=Mucilaginibacter antarcticus TaxID=1855725 RepID=UPI00364507BF